MRLLASLLIVCCLPAYGASEASEADRNAIIKIERELADAQLRGDASVWDRHISPRLLFTNPGGVVHDAKQATEGLRDGTLKFTSVQLKDVRVELFGDTAIVSYDITQEVPAGSPPYGGHFQWTDTFQKQAGRWVLIARHGSARR